MSKNFKYDLFISIGEDCACTSYLRNCKLQFSSFPFDWLTHATFEKRIEILCNDFHNFLNIEDLYYLNYDKNPHNHFDSYGNKLNDFHFYHDFAQDTPLEVSYPDVREKYNRRIERLYQKINQAKKVLFVWFSRDKVLSNQQLTDALSKLTNKFSNTDVNLLVLENNFDKTCNEIRKTEISKNITKYSFNITTNNFDNALDECMGNKELAYQIFNQYRISSSNFVFAKMKKILINLIPSKQKRHELRERV